MGSKLGFLLSLFFVIGLMGLSGDLASIQAIQTSLDAAGITAARRIALVGGIDGEVRALVEEECGGNIVSLEEDPVRIGDIYRFAIEKEYQPFVLSQEPVLVRIERSAVIGYLD